ncbi:MAG: DUF4258 domain-containing protein [Bacteroidetes bacterium]|nr:DUF4258 domain-containing protein [Bacteroidota bacterium]
MTFIRKLSVYLTGFTLGLIIVYFLFRDRSFPKLFPGDAVIEILNSRPLRFTRHALCRMDCREITEAEVREILKRGKVNFRKSRVRSKPCPSYAVEGISHEGQHIRAIVGNCDTVSKLITVIDLLKSYQCECE